MLEKINIKIADLSFTYGATLKLVVELGSKSINGEREDIVKEFMYTSKDKYTNVNKLSTLSFNPRWYLTIETKSKKDLGRKENICILPKQVPALIKLLQKMETILTLEDLFIINDLNPHDVKLEVDTKYKGRTLSSSFGFKGKDIISAMPEVFYQEESYTPVEGLLVTLNGDDNVSFNMSIDEVTYLSYILDKTDFIAIVSQVISTVAMPNTVDVINMDVQRGNRDKYEYTSNPEIIRQGNSNVVSQLLNKKKSPTVEDFLI